MADEPEYEILPEQVAQADAFREGRTTGDAEPDEVPLPKPPGD